LSEDAEASGSTCWSLAPDGFGRDRLIRDGDIALPEFQRLLSGRSTNAVKTHLVELGYMRQGDFEAFVNARASRLAELAAGCAG
jgi:hypothetical protein